MTASNPLVDQLNAINRTAAFNRWLDLKVASAAPGAAELHLRWREEFGQYSGFLHAGIVAALLDTACGYAAATVVGRVLASHFTMNCMLPAVGEAFVVHGKLVRAGKRQIFTTAELFATRDGASRLVATGETLLMPVEERAAA